MEMSITEHLRARAAHHKRLAAMYEELADLEESTPQAESLPKQPKPHNANGTVMMPGVQPLAVVSGNRFRQIADYIKRSGPKTRGEVIHQLGLPKGTVDMVLYKHKDQFSRDDAGRYTFVGQ